MKELQVADLDLDYVLKDDSSMYGGVSYHGEKLLGFLEETNLIDEHPSLDFSLRELNSILHDCGIRPIPGNVRIDSSNHRAVSHHDREFADALKERGIVLNASDRSVPSND